MSNAQDNPIPDISWYHAKSDAARLPKRCPFASAEMCPRYYESLWLLGDAGVTTKISNADKARLDIKWKGFEATIAEEAAGTSHVENELSSVCNFCPEVSFNVFGYFASSFYRYADEIDRELAHKRLARENVSGDDPRWRWAGVTRRHYTECREFSILSYSKKRTRVKKTKENAPTNSQTVNIQNFNSGVLGDVTASGLNITSLVSELRGGEYKTAPLISREVEAIDGLYQHILQLHDAVLECTKLLGKPFVSAASPYHNNALEATKRFDAFFRANKLKLSQTAIEIATQFADTLKLIRDLLMMVSQLAEVEANQPILYQHLDAFKKSYVAIPELRRELERVLRSDLSKLLR